MSLMFAEKSQEVRISFHVRAIRILGGFAAAGLLLLAALPLRAQTPTFDPSFTVGAGIQTGLHPHRTYRRAQSCRRLHTWITPRLYFNGDVTKYISVMFNTRITAAAPIICRSSTPPGAVPFLSEGQYLGRTVPAA